MSRIGSRLKERVEKLERPCYHVLQRIDNVSAVKFAFGGKPNDFCNCRENVNYTSTKQIATHKNFTLSGCRMNFNSSFKSVTVHFAWMPFSPTTSEHEQLPVQLLEKASERTVAAWQSTTA